MTSEAYLRRLGLDTRPGVCVESLRALHRAHVERIPYDNLSIQLDRPDAVATSAQRAADGGRVGYCFQQNTAFESLLADLGFATSRRHAHVWTRPADQFDDELNHLALVVSGLPTEANPGGHWWVDVGLGDAFAEPLPLVRGEHEEDGFRFEIGAGYGAQAAGRPTGPAAWTFRHDPAGVFSGVVVTSRPSDPAAVEQAHLRLGSGPDSPFRRVLVVQRRDGATSITLRGCVLHEVTATSRRSTDVTTYAAWREALERLALPVGDVTEQEWQVLWARTRGAHEAWDLAGRP
ncbi:arylamine N-acetyltransferase family protein [Nocardioides currus]|uniref:Arylamine N-acetyltransferase n=1 Tax=Nocardioides currus TaxID=2133958 RepID=A0A2R7YW07_9ACTN|nr:arylamine N-acetyltransferase [Nocardioides currus]PUA80590.1 arylamine N-acetyltransferase [Nocardioides currus]